MNDHHNAQIEPGKKVRRMRPMRRWEVHLPISILWYDRNTYHYSDSKLMLKSPRTDGSGMGRCGDYIP